MIHSTGISHYGEQGVFWGMTFARLITEDAKALALSDAVMIASTFLCVPYVKVRVGLTPVNEGQPSFFFCSVPVDGC